MGVRDSKELSPKKRNRFSPLIKSLSLTWAIGLADNTEIDQLGILPATRLAMGRAVNALIHTPDHLLIDALFLPDLEVGQTALIKGDQRSLSIAAASVLAKTARDEWMTDIHEVYTSYQFDRHKGYGTRLHQRHLDEEGYCPIHRTSYLPVKKIIKSGGSN